jgi:hypothetical protein
MHTTAKIVLVGAVIGTAVAGATAPANAQYYPPPYGYGPGPTWNGCPRVTRCRVATAPPIKVRSAAAGVPGTAVPRVTRYRAATALPIKVRSAAIRDADGTAIELK